ncbi:hypothetical protein M758_UG040500 [Ceratodon purpureus]|nr:hypothetical protein M758_UG040500 [Ceratodon purpureus]
MVSFFGQVPWHFLQSIEGSYSTTFGLKSEVRDMYDEEPRWVETVLQEYELGVLGPMHNCQGYCQCISCTRLAWIHNPIWCCPYGLYRLCSFSLDDAMRRKWSKSRCSPPSASTPDASICLCILLLPTQEWVPSPSSSNSLPSDLLEDHHLGLDITATLTEKEAAILLRIVDRLEAEGRLFTTNEVTSHGTELLVNKGTTVLLSGEALQTKATRGSCVSGYEG